MRVKSFAVIIEELFHRNGGWKRLQGELAIYYWPQIAGREISAKTEASFYRDGYLFIKTENPALAQQLSLMQTDILRKINRKIGKGVIKGLKVKIGSIKTTPFNQEQTEMDVQLDETDMKKISDCSSLIKDPDLATKFQQMMDRSYRKNQKQLANGGGKCRACNIVIDSEYDYCPCCERRLKEETDAYLQYLKKNNKTTALDFQKAAQDMNHLFFENVAKK